MGARTKARKRALDILFEADSKNVPVASILAEHVRRRDVAGEPALNDYTVTLVEGVAAHQGQIDTALHGAAKGWTVERMPAVDRAILRLGTYELLFSGEVPAGVAISEAVDLATSLSTDESPAFVNGVLAGIVDGDSKQGE
ncbi:MAG: transcription antitermination factor NusB [Candidatus Nanopelagicales bacterium]|jgi:N utilization substance protein B